MSSSEVQRSRFHRESTCSRSWTLGNTGQGNRTHLETRDMGELPGLWVHSQLGHPLQSCIIFLLGMRLLWPVPSGGLGGVPSVTFLLRSYS